MSLGYLKGSIQNSYFRYLIFQESKENNQQTIKGHEALISKTIFNKNLGLNLHLDLDLELNLVISENHFGKNYEHSY